MDITNWLVPIFSLLGAAIGASIGAWLQKRYSQPIEERKQLALQKGQAFTDYFRSIAASAHGVRNRDILSAAADAKVRICLYGSSDVIERLSKYDEIGANTAAPGAKEILISLLKSMRKDIGGDELSIPTKTLEVVMFGK